MSQIARPLGRRAQRALGLLVTVPLAAAVLAALVGLVVVPRAVGGAALVVLTGSMAPHVPAGSVVVDRPVDPRTLRVGDVVTYQLPQPGTAYVTHRVVAVGGDGAGGVVLTTRGDANGEPDPEPVPGSAVRGRVWYSVPVVGSLADGLPDKGLLLLLAGAALAAYAAALAASAVGDRRRAAAAPWAGRTTSRELLVATLTTGGGDLDGGGVDLDALERLLHDFDATVVAATDATVSVSVAAAPAVLDDAVDKLKGLGPLHVQRSGVLQAPTGRGAVVGGASGRRRAGGVA